MKKRVFLLLLLGLCLAAPARSATQSGNFQPPPPTYADAPPASMVGKIVAVVNGERITALDIEKVARPEIVRRGLNPSYPEHRTQIKEIYQQALNAQISDHLLYQEAVRLKTELPDNEVEKELARIMQQRKLGPQELEKQLKQEGMDTKKLRDQIRRTLLRQRLVSSMVFRKVVLPRDEVLKYYEEHKESFRAITEVRLAIIVYPPDVNAEAVSQSIKSGKLSFEEAVRRYSIDPATNKVGGAMPPAVWKDMSPDWRTRISSMNIGGLSDLFPIPHPQYQLKAQVKLLERIGEGKALSLAEATPEIESILREPLLKARFDEYVQLLRSRAIVDIKGL